MSGRTKETPRSLSFKLILTEFHFHMTKQKKKTSKILILHGCAEKSQQDNPENLTDCELSLTKQKSKNNKLKEEKHCESKKKLTLQIGP